MITDNESKDRNTIAENVVEISITDFKSEH